MFGQRIVFAPAACKKQGENQRGNGNAGERSGRQGEKCALAPFSKGRASWNCLACGVAADAPCAVASGGGGAHLFPGDLPAVGAGALHGHGPYPRVAERGAALCAAGAARAGRRAGGAAQDRLAAARGGVAVRAPLRVPGLFPRLGAELFAQALCRNSRTSRAGCRSEYPGAAGRAPGGPGQRPCARSSGGEGRPSPCPWTGARCFAST